MPNSHHFAIIATNRPAIISDLLLFLNKLGDTITICAGIMCQRWIVDEFVSATRGKSNSMVFTFSRFFCHNRGCFSNCLNLFVRQPLPSIYFCVCMTVYVCVQSFYVSMCVFVFVVRAGELSSQMLIVHKYVDSNKSIQISPLKR